RPMAATEEIFLKMKKLFERTASFFGNRKGRVNESFNYRIKKALQTESPKNLQSTLGKTYITITVFYPYVYPSGFSYNYIACFLEAFQLLSLLQHAFYLSDQSI